MVCNIFIIAGDAVKPERPAISLIKAVEETVHIKRDTGRRERYVKELERYLKQFARGREQTPVQDIDDKAIEAWFADRCEKPASRASSLGRLSAMFEVCWRRGYIAENPVNRIEKPMLVTTAPAIFTLSQCARSLIWTKDYAPEFLGWLTLALLAGIRPEECDKIKADDIDLKRGEVRIDAAASKVRKRRIVRLSLAAVAWLRIAAPWQQISVSTRRRRIRALRQALRLKTWPQDVLRHTAASYLLARHQDAGKVAMMLGNSADILNAHYKELVPIERGVRFCGLLPSPAMVKRANVPEAQMPRVR